MRTNFFETWLEYIFRTRKGIWKYVVIVVSLDNFNRIDSHMKDETNCPPFQRRYFQGHFPEWKHLKFNDNFTEMCSLWSNLQYGSIGSDNGLVPDIRQAIIWTNDALGFWRIYASHDLNELSCTSYLKLKYIDRKFHLILQ